MSERPGITELSAEELGEVSGGCGEHRGHSYFRRGAEALHALAEGAREAFHAWTGRGDDDCRSESNGDWQDDDRKDSKGSDDDWQDGGDDWQDGKGSDDDGRDSDDEERRCERDGDDKDGDKNDDKDGDKDGDKNDDKDGEDDRKTKDWDQPTDNMWT